MAAPLHHRVQPWHTLHGKVVMVTGASSGLGRDFCLDLAKAGCKIVAAARRVDRLMSLCHQINQSTSSEATDTRSVLAVAVELDVCADGNPIDKSVQKAWDAFGRIDALVNNAGVRGNVRSSLELCEEEWNHVCVRMRDAQIKVSIVNISSAADLNRGLFPGTTAYATSKVGVDMLTKVMAMEFETYRIRVNSISPNFSNLKSLKS